MLSFFYIKAHLAISLGEMGGLNSFLKVNFLLLFTLSLLVSVGEHEHVLAILTMVWVPAALPSPRSSLEMQNISLHYRPTERELAF